MAEQEPPLTQRALIAKLGLASHTISKLYGNKFKRVDKETQRVCADRRLRRLESFAFVVLRQFLCMNLHTQNTPYKSVCRERCETLRRRQAQRNARIRNEVLTMRKRESV